MFSDNIITQFVTPSVPSSNQSCDDETKSWIVYYCLNLSKTNDESLLSSPI